jgi:hypothetical protein
MSDLKVVTVTYSVKEWFAIPSNINLHDPEQVNSYHVKWNELIIELKNGKEITIQPIGGVELNDNYKYPDDVKIQDYKDLMFGFSKERFDEVSLDDEEDDEADDEEEREKIFKEKGCEKCSAGFYKGLDRCRGCNFDYSCFNTQEDDDEEDTCNK